jgi:acyl-CoA thioesterase
LIDPRRYRARARSGHSVLAETTGAVRVDSADGPPRLYFPLADVLAPELTETGPGELADYGSFDPDTVRIDIIDDPTGDPRDVIVTRFPTWGDATELIDIMDVRPVGPGRYEGMGHPDWRRPVVEGSQMLGQCVVAAGRHAPGRRVVSAHMVFPRAADARLPLHFELDEVSAGRTFTTVTARVTQGGRCCAVGTLLLGVVAPDVIRHAAPAPVVASPFDCPFVDMSVTGRDLRVADAAYTGDPDAPVGPPVLDAWVRFVSVPPDQCLHAGLLAQFCGHLPIAAALRPHAGIGQDQAHRTLSTAINAIAISFHGDVAADAWMHYHHEATSASAGMTHSVCQVRDQAGELMASFTVDAMVRAFTAAPPSDHRTAL